MKLTGFPAKCLSHWHVLDPVAFFPLNAAYGTKEINNRTVNGILGAVTLAPGPDGRPNYSYKFSGSSNSYIEFRNRIGGPLDVRYSMTMLCSHMKLPVLPGDKLMS
ncbi:unnamed protein product [Porites evermanni]|uniref:Uncharacterized protein n=1 Tax=Porites evermanni TaxID=104178 RepID=A0ABN8LUK0_9CNID|nr:unnamed protein product [Porites evermanni]